MEIATVGPYRVIEKLGEGGMGEVYRGHDASLGRDVALKLLTRDLADDPERRARMLREARAAAALNHPNICTVYEVGEAAGRPFIAMEVVEGRSLSARIVEGPLSVDEALHIGVQLADAVAHAHDRGIVHRDLKGANVMVTPEGRVKVLDFGLAAQVSDQQLTDLTTHSVALATQAHAVLGTLPYMAPEQLRGTPADARSDVWALGVVLYEMVSGKRPFDATTGFALSAAILHEPCPRLPAGVPRSLQSVVACCLEKEPGRRYQRAAELRAALEAVRANLVARDAPVARVTRRHLFIVGALATVLIAAGATLWVRDRRRASDAAGQIQSLAVLPLQNLSGHPGEEYFVTGMHEALITDLARIGLKKVIAKPSTDVFKSTTKTLRDIARELGVDGLVTGSVIRAGDRVRITLQLVNAETGAVVWANRYEGSANEVLSLQDEVLRGIAREVRATLTPEQTARLANTHPANPAAHDAYLKGRALFAAFVNSPADMKRLDAARLQFEQAIQMDGRYAAPYAALSLVYLTASQSSLLPPRETFPKARVAASKAVELDDTLADAHAALAEVLTWYDWDWPGAEREIRRALELNPDSIDALRASEVFLTLVASRFDDAAQASQRIVTLDPLNPFARVQRAWVSFYSRRHEESLRHAQNLREMWPNTMMGPVFLAANYGVKRMAPEVKTACGTVMALLSGAYVMRPIGQCAWALAAVGQRGEALRLLVMLEHPPAGQWLDPAIMGQAYAELGDADRAIEWLRKGMQERSPSMIYMKTGASWDRIRGDARFEAMLRQMNFPP